jgi:hypothetical protein
MANLKVCIGALFMVVSSSASSHAQSISRVTGVVGATAGSAAASVGVSAGTGGSASGGGSGSGTADLSGLGSALSGQTYSGDLPGAVGVKMGDKVIQFRGAVGFGDQQNNYKVGAGIPF